MNTYKVTSERVSSIEIGGRVIGFPSEVELTDSEVAEVRTVGDAYAVGGAIFDPVIENEEKKYETVNTEVESDDESFNEIQEIADEVEKTVANKFSFGK